MDATTLLGSSRPLEQPDAHFCGCVFPVDAPSGRPPTASYPACSSAMAASPSFFKHMEGRGIVSPSQNLPIGAVEHGPYRRAVGSVGATDPGAPSPSRRPGQALARSEGRPQRHPLSFTHRRPLARSSQALPALPNLPPRLSTVGARRHAEERTGSSCRKPAAAGKTRSLRVLHRRHLRRS